MNLKFYVGKIETYIDNLNIFGRHFKDYKLKIILKNNINQILEQ